MTNDAPAADRLAARLDELEVAAFDCGRLGNSSATLRRKEAARKAVEIVVRLAASGEPPREPSEEAIRAADAAYDTAVAGFLDGTDSRDHPAAMRDALRAAYAAEVAAPRAPRAPDEPHQKEECPRCEGRGILPRDLDGPNVHPYCTLCGGTGFVVRTVSRGAPEP